MADKDFERMAQKRLSGSARFGTKEEALRAAVQRIREDEDRVEMVMREHGGKFLICDAENWELAITAGGCEPVYSDIYIYDLAAGRETSEADNQAQLDAMMNRPRTVQKAVSYEQLRGGK